MKEDDTELNYDPLAIKKRVFYLYLYRIFYYLMGK